MAAWRRRICSRRLDDRKPVRRLIPIIKPWAYICSKGFLVGLFLMGLIIGRNFPFQNGLGLTITTA